MKNSPIKQLSDDDLKRKEIKLQKILTQQAAPTTSKSKLKRLAEKKHKTEHQIKTGERGKPTTLKNEKWLAGISRKSALNMLGISPLNNDDDFDVDYSGAKPVDLGSIKPTERGKKIKAIKDDVSVTNDKGLVIPQQHDYFVTNPTEESDEMAVKIQDAKTKTLSGGGGKHYREVEVPLQEELKRKMRNK